MIAESVVILVLCALIASAFLRSRYRKALLSVLPISFLPATHLIVRGILALTNDYFFGIRAPIVLAFADVLALVFTCVFIIVLSKYIPNKKARRVYEVVMVGYSLLVGWIYIFSTLSPLLLVK